MKPFRVHKGLVAPLDRANVDTDQIIPKQFLKRIERTGFGQFLFYEWRFQPDGTPNSTFVLNDPKYAGASILVAAKNFGCGSSREHAPWALDDFGFRCVIAPSFADIFNNNCQKNGLLTITLPDNDIFRIMNRAKEAAYELTVDLEHKQVYDNAGFSAAFEIDDFKRRCLMEGLDDIAMTLQHDKEISEYEKKHPALA